jgi:Zn-dependent protease with chaperone function
VHLIIYLPLAVPLVAAACARPIASRLPPQAATWLLTGAAVALAGLSAAVLGVLVLTAVIRIPLVADIGDMSLQVIHRDDPASLSAAVTAGTLLAAATAAACRAAWRRARALLAAARHARCLPGSSQVVVVPDGTADAYAVPGWPGRIVVTAGMLDALNPAERQVLLEHERAHATGHHYLFTALTYFAAAANPLLRPVAAAVTYTIERWADERAARACGDRRLAARAIGKAALASAEGMTPGIRTGRPAAAAAVGIAGPAAAVGIAGPAALRGAGRLRGAGPVPRRVAALLAPPPRIRPLLVVAVAGLVLISGVSALDAARDLHAVVELAQAPRMS